jgi:hypothetical protein
MTLGCHIDHLVVAAETLEQGAQWCEATLGVVPAAGGEHPLMGTHNRLLRTSTERYPRSYFEIIAINPAAPAPKGARWFDLDDPVLRQAVRRQPRLVHFVARTDDATAALESLQRLGIERGPLRQAERPTPSGLLRWQMSLRPDGQRLFHGGLPMLIEWGGVHPSDNMGDSGLALQSLEVRHPRWTELKAAYDAIGLRDVALKQGPPNLSASFMTPKGLVTIESAGT